ncbi:MAG: hypothetical protein E6Q97_27665 [Desulfurellales bacterium]|nr:MAG: hypothetical protein E6Q97_27665 [Desulfurellales bacterium]
MPIEAKIKLPGEAYASIAGDTIHIGDVGSTSAAFKRAEVPALINAINTLMRWADEASGAPTPAEQPLFPKIVEPKPVATPEGSAQQLLALMKRLREDGETIVYVTPGPSQEWIDVAAQIAGEGWDWRGDHAKFGDFGRLYFHDVTRGDVTVEKPRKIVEAA